MSLPNGWVETTLNDTINIKIDNRGRNPEKYLNNGIPVIDNYLITGEKYINFKNIKRYIDIETYNNFIRNYLNYNDILITLVGNGYGNVSLAPKQMSVIVQNTIGLRCNKANDNIFIFYYLKANKKSLENMNIGAAQPSIKVGNLLNLKVKIPSKLEEQKAIANILSSFDNKIELLKEQNKTLETMSQTIFKESITDKDNLIETTLGEMVNIKYGKDHKHLDNGSFPLYGSGGIMRYVERPLYEKESILIPRKGTLSNLFFVQEPFWSVDTIFYTEIDDTKVFPIYLYYQLKRFNLANLNVGSAVPSLTTSVLNAIKLNIPTINEQRKTVNSLKELNKKFLYNISQIETLSKTRDTLLPKLMNGSIRLNISGKSNGFN